MAGKGSSWREKSFSIIRVVKPYIQNLDSNAVNRKVTKAVTETGWSSLRGKMNQ